MSLAGLVATTSNGCGVPVSLQGNVSSLNGLKKAEESRLFRFPLKGNKQNGRGYNLSAATVLILVQWVFAS